MTCRTVGELGFWYVGMRSKASVAVRTLRSPSPTATSLSVTNVNAMSPPSPRQVQLGAFRSSSSQTMFVGPAVLQRPAVLSTTLTTRTPGGGYHWNELMAPRVEVLKTVIW